MATMNEDDVNLHLGRRIRRRRRLLGLTQAQLGRCCGVGYQQIQKYETADNRIFAAQLWRLAEALGTPVSYFYEGLPGADARALVADDHPS
jgi:transcriptional regulator with XRE-family HTH domain